jgi:4-diphosphocytidyl-2-C-methyl-D-erythritol kinase
MQVQLNSPCKVNLILNILAKRPDGFHELETIMHPVGIFDLLSFERIATGVDLTSDHPELPTDSRNLVHRSATAFLYELGTKEGVRIHLQKKIPMEAGLGGGSGNAATTLLGLNEIFGKPLAPDTLQRLAASLGSDIPFFLQSAPAIATGRGEQVKSLPPFRAFDRYYFVLIHPGFGVSTPWAYKNLARFPAALNGERGRAERLVKALGNSIDAALPDFYNSLEAPVLEKFPLLSIFQEFLLEHGAVVALMSGSGSTTFALVQGADKAQKIQERFREKFGLSNWIDSVPVHSPR